MGGGRRLKHTDHSRKGFRARCKRLFYSALLSVPLLAFSTNAGAFPRNSPVGIGKGLHAPRAAKMHPVTCKMNGKVLEYTLSDGTRKTFPDILMKGENALSTSCNDRFASVLTNTSLITVPGKTKGAKSNGGISVDFLEARKDMRQILKKGVVAWAHGDDKCFFLTRDGKIREIPVYLDEKTIPVYSLAHKVNRAEMAFRSGFLFIAPVNGKMVVMKITDEANYVELRLPANMEGAVFFLQGRKLYFGKKDGLKVEIRIKGNQLSDVKLFQK